MTTITVRQNTIEVKGHSGYKEIGSDIICATISTTSQFLQNLTECDYEQTEDSYILHIESNNKNAIVFKGLMKQLAKQYKEYVRVIEV